MTSTLLYKCRMCTSRFVTNKEQLSHEKSHNITPPYSCVECKQTFLFKCDFQTHQSTIHKLLIYKCRFCNKYYDNIFSSRQCHKKCV
jgi:hypothetical protein